MSHGTELSGHGPLSRADPRLKVVVLVVWSTTVAVVWSMAAALAGLAGAMVLLLLLGCDRPWVFIKRLILLNTFLVFVWLLLPFSFSVPGETVFRLGPLSVTRQGLALAALLSVKSLAITCGAMAVTVATGVFELIAACRALGAPVKLTAMMSLMSRYIRVVADEFGRLVWAMRIRGFKPMATVHCLRTWANLAGVLLVRGIDRSERVHAAMLCRGWRGGLALDRDYRLSALDRGLIALFLAMTAVVVTLDVVF
jgi:cobalt/nickel transport system permease protein